MSTLNPATLTVHRHDDSVSDVFASDGRWWTVNTTDQDNYRISSGQSVHARRVDNTKSTGRAIIAALDATA